VSRILTLAWFITKDFFRSWQSFVPLALALTFYGIAFQYGATPAYFATVTPVAMIVIAIVSVLLLAGRFNRAATFPFIARLHQRSELLLAVVLTALALTLILSGLITGMALLQHKFATPLTGREWLLLALIWPCLFLFASFFGLLLTNLSSRGSSHIIVYALVAAFAAIYDYQFELTQAHQTFLLGLWQRILDPISTALTPFTSANLVQAALLVLGYALVCFIVADWLFARKDLVWSE